MGWNSVSSHFSVDVPNLNHHHHQYYCCLTFAPPPPIFPSYILIFVWLNAATTLTSWHLLVTFCSLHVALCMKLFEHKPFDARAVMGFGILNGISIGLLNLSLGFNSVGFYQVCCLLCVRLKIWYLFIFPISLLHYRSMVM